MVRSRAKRGMADRNGRLRLGAGWALLALAVLAVVAASAASLPSARQKAQPEATQRYGEAAVELDRFIRHEMQVQALPGLSIALVDGGQIVWARGYGFADPEGKVAATADTLYRAGSLSKLFTDVAILKLVDRGAFDLDAPITRYLPDFHPGNPFTTPITLRELMTDRSGLVREAPSADASGGDGRSLKEIVDRLDGTTLVYWPSTHVKESDAAFAVAGYAIERAAGQPFAGYVDREVLAALGMKESSFAADSRMVARLAKGRMWTYDGRSIPLPTTGPRIAPARGVVTTARDMGRFLGVLFTGGSGAAGAVLSRKSIEEMWTPQFAHADATSGLGLGFAISQIEGQRLVSRSGAAAGFSSELAALPGERLGVAVMTNLGGAKGVTAQVARVALRLMLAARHHRRLPKIPQTSSLPAGMTLAVAGRYGSLSDAFDLIDRGNRLFFLRVAGGEMVRVRQLGPDFIQDGRLGYGLLLTEIPGGMRVEGSIYPRYRRAKPRPMREAWRGLIGEYGGESDTVYILEKDGKLTALVDWFEYDPLQQISASTFAFPRYGLFDGERAIFRLDASGEASEVDLGGVVYRRRALGGVTGQFFHITPVKPIDELRREALAAKPPVERGQFRKPDLVDVTSLDPAIHLDIRYATKNDFLRTPVYTEAKAFMQRPAAEAMVRVAHKLAPLGYGLLIHDAYRPWYVTKIFWDATPVDKHIFVADPAEGSRHNRGCAVDLTLYDLKTGKAAAMTGVYDEMSERSYPFYPGGSSLERWDRDLLRHAMEAEGFTVYEFEWWHFDYQGWQHYPILNLTFEQLSRRREAPEAPHSHTRAHSTPSRDAHLQKEQKQ
jgi:CubicO group peptidase (beta-lactamase class C family)/D-alanyl-D-alanine dipeptidase